MLDKTINLGMMEQRPTDTMAYGVNVAGAAGTIDWTVTVTSGNIL